MVVTRKRARLNDEALSRALVESRMPTVSIGDDSPMMVDVGTQTTPYRRRRTYRRKKKVTYRRRRGGYPVYKPTGAIAGVIGRGGYFTDALGAAGRAIRRMTPSGAFSRIGQAAGGALGGGMGARMGSLLGEGISKVAGFGAYEVRMNSLMIPEGQQIPSFGDMSQATIIRHREFITDIQVPASAGTFTNAAFPINPGLGASFPWMTTLSQNYDQYQILGLIYEFRSTFSENATTTGPMGSVIMSTDYDSTDALYSSKLAMENSQFTVSAKPSCDMIHIVECDPSCTFAPMKYLRHGAIPANRDVRLYDHGNFQIATVGLPGGATGVIGELWCTYEIALFKPQIPTGPGAATIFAGGVDHFVIPPANVGVPNYFGLGQDPTYAGIGGVVAVNVYQFPAGAVGRFGVAASFQGASTVLALNLSLGTLTNCSPLNLVANQTTSQIGAPVAGATSSTCMVTRYISISAAQAGAGLAAISMSQGTLPTGITSADLFVYRLNDDIL